MLHQLHQLLEQSMPLVKGRNFVPGVMMLLAMIPMDRSI